MSGPLIRLFDELSRADVSYCLLRDAERLDGLVRGGELDLLVHPDQLTSLKEVLAQLGFVQVTAWGHAPHHFFLSYDEAEDSWLKCDVVTEVSYGRPVHNLRTDLGTACLAHRRPVGATFAPSPEEELVTLLIHSVIDKQRFAPERIARLKTLRQRVTRSEEVSTHLARCWSPAMTWARLARTIDEDRWEELLASRRALIRRLARQAPVGTVVRGVRDRTLRKLRRAAGLVRPAAPSVALLAPDGAGKSTLTTAIRDRFPFPVTTVYMGLYQEPRRSRSSRVPGLGLAENLLTQWRRYVNARMRQADGHLVVFDRYAFDAWLPTARRLTPLKRFRRLLLARSCPAPDLSIVLDAPGEVLYARKHEHDIAALEQQRQAYRRLGSTIPGAVLVDATCGPDEVRRAVMALIWRRYRQTNRGRSPGEDRPEAV